MANKDNNHKLSLRSGILEDKQRRDDLTYTLRSSSSAIAAQTRSANTRISNQDLHKITDHINAEYNFELKQCASFLFTMHP